MNKTMKSIISALLAISTLFSMVPLTVTTYAAQSNEYVDPADRWLPSSGRTNEFDVNATTTYETQFCTVCNRDTTVLTYRVPEYTKSGETALNRGVQYSDGTCMDGESRGNLDDGVPGVDAYYTAYHWTKVVCQTCGTINCTSGPDAYGFNKNVYALYDCDHNFFRDFDNTTYEPYDANYHLTTLKKGEYCQFCKGTHARANEKKEAHSFVDTVDAQIGNNRFFVTHTCEDCGYKTSEYVTAKSVVGSYYGVVDGEAHTLDISDLSESGVKTSIKYGNDAEHCTLNSAPNYTKAGYNKVYYKITYSYGGESMTENGVSYVWLLDDSEKESKDTVIIIAPEKKAPEEKVHEHDYRYIETVPASCDSLGYERWQCAECGALEKKNYVQFKGHDYDTIVIRESNCNQGGLTMHICKNCGDFFTETTPVGGHNYRSKVVNPTCENIGYTEHTCGICGESYITDIVPVKSHTFESVTKKPSCTEKGYTTYTCKDCGFHYVSDYSDAIGHDYDDGHVVTSSGCDAEGVMEYHCKNCDKTELHSIEAKGHKPGKAATCTEPQICEDCGTVLELPKGHSYNAKVYPPSCSAMGYTEYVCKDCGDTYTGDYVDRIAHKYHKDVIKPTCTEHGYTKYTCLNCDDEFISDYTDKLDHNYEAVVTAPTCTAMGFTTYTCKTCGESYVSDYTEVLPHNYNKETVEPTCTEHGYAVYTCPDCGKSYIGDYTDVKQHHYSEQIIAPTCTAMGYTIFTCDDCGDTYNGNYTDKIAHEYEAKVSAPTCSEFGFSTYTCKNCGERYVSDYTDKLPHNYEKEATEPTCKASGYTTYTCKDCGDTYVAGHKDKLDHDYEKTVTEPTCKEHGFTTYVCKDCGETLIADYTNTLPHNYEAVVTAPTCSEFGFTTYTCKDCGDSYVADYTDKLGHKLESVVKEPTCTEIGYTTYTCADCGYSFKADYVEQLGHTPSAWIIDEPATIEHAGKKHIECERCHEVLANSEIEQLIEENRTDEDGKSEVGAYSIILTDKDGKPVFDSRIVIDTADKVTIELPEGRLLDYADPTTVTVFDIKAQAPASELNIFIYDKNGNAAVGVTNENGQISFPNEKTNTGDEGGTIGGDIEESKETFVIRVTDKNNVIIPNCDVYIGESNNIVVDLPDGIKPTSENPVIVTITDADGKAQVDFTVIVLGDADFIEKGKTDMYGKVTLPSSREGYTDKDGIVRVNDVYVAVRDENKPIENAFIKLNDDDSVSVILPDGSVIDYANRITVTVSDKDGNKMENISVTVTDANEKTASDATNTDGQITVPALNEDITDADGNGKVNGHIVNISDENGTPIEGAFIKEDEDGKITADLPDGTKIDINDRIIVTVVDEDGKPIKDIPVEVSDKDGNKENNLTDENGKAVVPPTDKDYTDVNGYGELDGYAVSVINENGAIEKAYLEIDRESGKISVTLPEGVKLDDYANRVTVTVTKKADNTPVKDIEITITDTPAKVEGEDVVQPEPKTAIGKTDMNGKVTVPPLSEDITDKDGKSDVTEEKTVDGKDTDGDGEKDTPDEVVTTTYAVSVKDTKGIIENSFIEIKDGKVFVTLPDGNTLTTSNQTTVTVTDKDGKPVKGVNVTVTDKNNTKATKDTDTNGQITVPVKSSTGGGGGSSRSGGGGGGISVSSNTTNITVTDKDGKTVSVSKSTDSNGNITLTLPTGYVIDDSGYYTVKATDNKGNAKADVNITLKDRKDGVANGKTDKDGKLILPYSTHSAYIFGYEDGTFRADNDMTRAEAAAIFARLISESKNEAISGKASFKDIDKNEWYAKEVGYLESYGIIKGYEDNTFRPDDKVTRAELVTMAVRFYDIANEVKLDSTSAATKYKDVAKSYWAVKEISFAKDIGWLNGYADGTFKGDNNITRAEAVTVVNRATGRDADRDYITKNYTRINRFTDVKNSDEWYFFDVLEAANAHTASKVSGNEAWVK